MSITPGLRRIFKSFVKNPTGPGRVDTYDPGYLVVENGRIVRLSRRDPGPEFPDAEIKDWSGHSIVPGFIDTHVHFPQYAIMGVGRGELLDWLRDFTYPEEARFSDPEYAAGIVEKFFSDMIANGTTAAAIYSSIHEEATNIAFATAARKGVRAFIGKVMMDRNSPEPLLEDTEQSIEASLRLFEKWDGAENGRLRYVFTPRFAGSCSMELMQRTGKIARDRSAFVQSHLSENKQEVELIRRLFPGASSYAEVYGLAGLLHERSVMAHCIHLSSDEVALLARTRTNVAFCPYSNRMLRSGSMPYRILRDAGLNIGMGTDVAGGPSLSMLDQMREARDSVTLDEALYLATMGGATSLGIADRVGNFAPGKDADMVVIDEKKDLISAVYLRGEQVYGL